MRLPALLAILALAAPAWAQESTRTARAEAAQAQAARGQAAPARASNAVQEWVNVRITARIVVVDREALTRAGVEYVVLGNDRVRIDAAGGRGGAGRFGVRGGQGGFGGSGFGGRGGARIGVGVHGVTAFLDAARESRWIRSESTQHVLTLSGGEGVISSTDLALRRGAARTRGPSLVVSPTVLEDGSVHLWVSARLEDSVTYPWGYGVDGSPAAVDSEIIARDGEEILLASSSSVQSTRESGLLHWAEGEQGRDVLVAVTAEVVR